MEATISAPVIKQRLRNNCEATALEILLASRGVESNQLILQRQLRRDGPLDPQGDGAEKIWGDPNFGFVGRPDGGGTAGGFGVYPGPIASLSSRYEMKLRSLSGRPPREVYRRLLAGDAVMVWVGLADGPYARWRSPRGAEIEVNLNEHTVVLNGIDRRGSLSVVDPLSGTRQTWTKSKFETMWRLLGRRALST
ncbi:MAG: C39 family peptidase [Actinobacteria bacterium]|nr:C39 family peptidase [Actinomycetota bacterium]